MSVAIIRAKQVQKAGKFITQLLSSGVYPITLAHTATDIDHRYNSFEITISSEYLEGGTAGIFTITAAVQPKHSQTCSRSDLSLSLDSCCENPQLICTILIIPCSEDGGNRRPAVPSNKGELRHNLNNPIYCIPIPLQLDRVRQWIDSPKGREYEIIIADRFDADELPFPITEEGGVASMGAASGFGSECCKKGSLMAISSQCLKGSDVLLVLFSLPNLCESPLPALHGGGIGAKEAPSMQTPIISSKITTKVCTEVSECVSRLCTRWQVRRQLRSTRHGASITVADDTSTVTSGADMNRDEAKIGSDCDALDGKNASTDDRDINESLFSTVVPTSTITDTSEVTRREYNNTTKRNSKSRRSASRTGGIDARIGVSRAGVLEGESAAAIEAGVEVGAEKVKTIRRSKSSTFPVAPPSPAPQRTYTYAPPASLRSVILKSETVLHGATSKNSTSPSSSSSSNGDRAATPVQREYIPATINSPKPIPFRTNLFEGESLFVVNSQSSNSAAGVDAFGGKTDQKIGTSRASDSSSGTSNATIFHTFPPHIDRFSANPKNKFELAVQGRFLRVPDGPLFFGGEITKRMELGLFTKGLCSSILSMGRSINPLLHHSFGDKEGKELPHIVGPFWSVVDRLVITPGSMPKPSIYEPFDEPLEERNRRKKDAGAQLQIDLTSVYSFSFKTSKVNFETWTLVDIPLMKPLNLSTFWADSDMKFVAYTVSPTSGASKSSGTSSSTSSSSSSNGSSTDSSYDCLSKVDLSTLPKTHVQEDNEYIFSLEVQHVSNHTLEEWEASSPGFCTFSDEDFVGFSGPHTTQALKYAVTNRLSEEVASVVADDARVVGGDDRSSSNSSIAESQADRSDSLLDSDLDSSGAESDLRLEEFDSSDEDMYFDARTDNQNTVALVINARESATAATEAETTEQERERRRERGVRREQERDSIYYRPTMVASVDGAAYGFGRSLSGTSVEDELDETKGGRREFRDGDMVLMENFYRSNSTDQCGAVLTIRSQLATNSSDLSIIEEEEKNKILLGSSATIVGEKAGSMEQSTILHARSYALAILVRLYSLPLVSTAVEVDLTHHDNIHSRAAPNVLASRSGQQVEIAASSPMIERCVSSDAGGGEGVEDTHKHENQQPVVTKKRTSLSAIVGSKLGLGRKSYDLAAGVGGIRGISTLSSNAQRHLPGKNSRRTLYTFLSLHSLKCALQDILSEARCDDALLWQQSTGGTGVRSLEEGEGTVEGAMSSSLYRSPSRHREDSTVLPTTTLPCGWSVLEETQRTRSASQQSTSTPSRSAQCFSSAADGIVSEIIDDSDNAGNSGPQTEETSEDEATHAKNEAADTARSSLEIDSNLAKKEPHKRKPGLRQREAYSFILKSFREWTSLLPLKNYRPTSSASSSSSSASSAADSQGDVRVLDEMIRQLVDGSVKPEASARWSDIEKRRDQLERSYRDVLAAHILAVLTQCEDESAYTTRSENNNSSSSGSSSKIPSGSGNLNGWIDADVVDASILAPLIAAELLGGVDTPVRPGSKQQQWNLKGRKPNPIRKLASFLVDDDCHTESFLSLPSESVLTGAASREGDTIAECLPHATRKFREHLITSEKEAAVTIIRATGGGGTDGRMIEKEGFVALLLGSRYWSVEYMILTRSELIVVKPPKALMGSLARYRVPIATIIGVHPIAVTRSSGASAESQTRDGVRVRLEGGGSGGRGEERGALLSPLPLQDVWCFAVSTFSRQFVVGVRCESEFYSWLFALRSRQQLSNIRGRGLTLTRTPTSLSNAAVDINRIGGVRSGGIGAGGSGRESSEGAGNKSAREIDEKKGTSKDREKVESKLLENLDLPLRKEREDRTGKGEREVGGVEGGQPTSAPGYEPVSLVAPTALYLDLLVRPKGWKFGSSSGSVGPFTSANTPASASAGSTTTSSSSSAVKGGDKMILNARNFLDVIPQQKAIELLFPSSWKLRHSSYSSASSTSYGRVDVLNVSKNNCIGDSTGDGGGGGNCSNSVSSVSSSKTSYYGHADAMNSAASFALSMLHGTSRARYQSFFEEVLVSPASTSRSTVPNANDKCVDNDNRDHTSAYSAYEETKDKGNTAISIARPWDLSAELLEVAFALSASIQNDQQPQQQTQTVIGKGNVSSSYSSGSDVVLQGGDAGTDPVPPQFASGDRDGNEKASQSSASHSNVEQQKYQCRSDAAKVPTGTVHAGSISSADNNINYINNSNNGSSSNNNNNNSSSCNSSVVDENECMSESSTTSDVGSALSMPSSSSTAGSKYKKKSILGALNILKIGSSSHSASSATAAAAETNLSSLGLYLSGSEGVVNQDRAPARVGSVGGSSSSSSSVNNNNGGSIEMEGMSAKTYDLWIQFMDGVSLLQIVQLPPPLPVLAPSPTAGRAYRPAERRNVVDPTAERDASMNAGMREGPAGNKAVVADYGQDIRYGHNGKGIPGLNDSGGVEYDQRNATQYYSQDAARVDFFSSAEAMSLYLNVYHCMVLHASLVVGIPSSIFQWSSFFRNNCYNAFGDVFSIAELEHCIIRNGMSAPNINALAKLFGVIPTEKFSFALSKCVRDYRLLWGMNCGSVSNLPYTPIYRPLALDRQLEYIIRCALERQLSLVGPNNNSSSSNSSNSAIMLPQMCSWYPKDLEVPLVKLGRNTGVKSTAHAERGGEGEDRKQQQQLQQQQLQEVLPSDCCDRKNLDDRSSLQTLNDAKFSLSKSTSSSQKILWNLLNHVSANVRQDILARFEKKDMINKDGGSNLQLIGSIPFRYFPFDYKCRLLLPIDVEESDCATKIG